VYRGHEGKALCVLELGIVEIVSFFALRAPRFLLTRNAEGYRTVLKVVGKRTVSITPARN
jgi:hypothetical protein